MPRTSKKTKRAAVVDKVEPSKPPTPAKKGRNEKEQLSVIDLPPCEDSPAKHTRSQEKEQGQPRSPDKETEFRPRKCLRRALTQDEEDDLVSWFRENSFLHNKSSAEFKFKEKKNRTWAAKEAELGLNPGDLSTIWYPNMRTQFSKLIKMSSKSGAGAAERTARQRWLLDSFGFLRPYLVQLRTQRGSKFAEKRKELTFEDTDDGDAVSDLSPASAVSDASGNRPKSARVLSSLTSELESVRGAIVGVQDAAAHTGQFLVHLMRQMDKQRMHAFVTRATRLALDLVDESLNETRSIAAQGIAQQTTAPVFAVPTIPTFMSPTNRSRATPSAAFGSVEQQQQYHQQQQIQQDFQLATNIAAAAPPAHLMPLLKSFTDLQPPNVQPNLLQQPLGSSSLTASAVTSTASMIRRAMDIASTPNTSFNLSQEAYEANLDAL